MSILVAIITLTLLGCANSTEPQRSDTQTVSPSPAGTEQPTSETQQAAPETEQATPAQSTIVLTDEGSGAGRTQQFTVDGAFEVRWTFTADQLQGQPVGYIGITLESVDGSLVDGGGLVANQTGSGQDVWHGQTGGTYVLGINAANGSWSLEVVDIL